jgi:Tfp pilus assembly protein PilX
MYLLALFGGLRERAARFAQSDDRGDVPGWVMITVMTAALVVALLAIAAPKLTDAFTKAISSVTG